MKITEVGTKEFKEKLDKLLLRRQKLLDRLGEEASRLIQAYRERRELALIDHVREFDGVELSQDQLWIEPDQIRNSHKLVSAPVRQAIEHTVKRVERFQLEMRHSGFQAQLESGLYWGTEIRALERVGIYVPKSFFLTIILCGVPARIAGVEELVVATPPDRRLGPPFVYPAVLYTCKLFSIDKILVSGGVSALAALSFGTESTLPVQKIVGPTGKLGMVAKQKLSGYVGIDSLSGPTEVAFICNSTSSLKTVVSDIIGLADHNPDGEVFLFHHDMAWIQNLLEELVNVLPSIKNLESRDSIKNCLENNLHFFVSNSLEKSIQVVNQLSPGTVVLNFEKASEYVEKIKSCGCLLLGPYTPPVSLDLFGGGTGIVPTLGAAAFSSMSSPASYQRIFSLIEVEKSALERLQHESLELAHTEGFSTYEAVFNSRLQ